LLGFAFYELLISSSPFVEQVGYDFSNDLR
jgi:hypothetical protein